MCACEMCGVNAACACVRKCEGAVFGDNLSSISSFTLITILASPSDTPRASVNTNRFVCLALNFFIFSRGDGSEVSAFVYSKRVWQASDHCGAFGFPPEDPARSSRTRAHAPFNSSTFTLRTTLTDTPPIH